MTHELGRAIGDLIATLMILCAIFVPLGLWKAVEIVVWLCRHVSVSFG